MQPYLELDKDLSPELAQLKEQVHRFAAEVCRPASIELDRLDPEAVIAPGSVLWDVFRQAYEQGFHTRSLPAEAGGLDLGPLGNHIIAEEMGWGSADFAIALGVTSFPFSFAAGRALEHPRLMAEVVRPFAEDRQGKYIGCWAITEPGHGSDTLAEGTEFYRDPNIFWGVTARLDGDEWVINGQKSAWVSNGTIATHALTFLGIEREKGMSGGGVALVPLDRAGVSKGKPLNKLGQRALNQGEIFFDDVRIPADYMLAGTDAYPIVIDLTLAGANAFMGATFTGVARAAFEEALNYARNRVQGGKPITEHQLVQKKLFDMYTKVVSARHLSRAALAYNAGTFPPATFLSIMSKVYCTQAALDVANDAVQLHGGYGLAKEFLVEKLFRDARASLIEDGSNDLLSLAAARQIIDRL
ncbi:MAG: acyl-CoA dehydrogenase family protein [Dehalococcoidia bacterium]